MHSANKRHKLSWIYPVKSDCLPSQNQIVIQLILHQPAQTQRYGRLSANHHLLRIGHGKRVEPSCNNQDVTVLPVQLRLVLVGEKDIDQLVSSIRLHL